MKPNKIFRAIIILLAALPIGFSACVKDQCKKTHTYTYYVPVYKTKAEVRANIKSNPAKALKNTGKFYISGNYIFLNEIDKGIHVIDNSNPAQPRNVAFIDIPGNVDLAVKGNMLYADLYTDLVAIDISNPSNIVVRKFIDFVFPERMYGGGFVASNTGQVIMDWKRVDTTITESCDGQGGGWWGMGRTDVFFATGNAAGGQSAAASAPTGIGGSMARFTIVNDYMYAVDRHTLRSVSLANAADPVLSNTINAGFDIETIYPFKNKLFLGSMGGMFIFDIANPASPVKQANFAHARACDPVIADDDYAFITLKSGTTCGPTADELLIVNVQNIQSPSLVKTYPLTGPKGLSKDNNLLFVCDGTAGLRVYNASDVLNLQLLKTITGIETYDVITWNNRAMVVAADGLYQYDYSDINNIRLLSKIAVNK
ncbi:MAG TPA: hypothetical protein VFI06_07090 [Chitinophagaceae bacterium]|nr:hypothetical protein [Chitinophagaceae bacterium]